ncbi:MAG: hypothetical protein KA226_06960 [Gemmatimonadales bacterium]|nr:hypothetical protein [Gemmatimonadales bacterium]MBP7620347.1 hypothetical protein [Gemmatimonadales bacterium]
MRSCVQALLTFLAIPLTWRAADGQSPPRPAFELVRELHIAGSSANLSPITFLVPTGAGGVVIGQRQDDAVRLFDSTGASRGTLGRRGEGPGEFRQILSGGLNRDTVWVYDGSLYRLTFFSIATGKYLRGARVDPGAGFPPTVRAVFGPDSLVFWGNGAPRNGRRERAWLRGQAVQSGLLGSAAVARPFEVIADFPPFGCFARAETAGIGIPHCHRPTEAVSGSGRRVAVLTKPRDAAADGYHVAIVGTRGDTIYSRSYRPPRFPMNPQVYQRAVDDLLVKVPASAKQAASLKAQMPSPSHYPPASFAFFDDGDRLWVGQRLEKGQYWEILDPTGRVVGDLRTPEGVALEAAIKGWVWGVEADRDGVESVVRFRLRVAPR